MLDSALSSALSVAFSSSSSLSISSSSAARMWGASGKTHAELVQNLVNSGLLRSCRVIAAFKQIDRRHFVPGTAAGHSHVDAPQDIGCGVTISAPHMHAYAVEALASVLQPGCRVLDVGSGSGLLSAIMAVLVLPGGRVFGIEHHRDLVLRSRQSIADVSRQLGQDLPADIVLGDGRLGLPAEAPFDAIHVGAAATAVPQPLLEQLKPGGKMVLPIGPENGPQQMVIVSKRADGSVTKQLDIGVRYVPLE